MIRYALRCDQAHRFDSWFGSSADFDRLRDGGPGLLRGLRQRHASAKDLMAPSIAAPAPRAARSSAPPRRPSRRWPSSAAASRPQSEDVGRDFAAEARRIHEGVAPERSIIGEARPPRPARWSRTASSPLPWRRSPLDAAATIDPPPATRERARTLQGLSACRAAALLTPGRNLEASLPFLSWGSN